MLSEFWDTLRELKNLVSGIPEVTKSSCGLTLTLTMQVIKQIERALVANVLSLEAVWCHGQARSRLVCHCHPQRQSILLLQAVVPTCCG